MYREHNHLILKIIVGIVALFLVAVAFMDFTPVSTPMEKTVVYGQK